MIGSLLLPILLSAVLIWAGGLNLAGPSFIRAEFAGWGYSDGLRIAVGLTEWVAAIALTFAPFRIVGCILAMLILLGVIVTLIRHRSLMRLEYPLVLLALTLMVAAQTFGLID
jgi:hypothetical protein